jgi:hypothetical protein
MVVVSALFYDKQSSPVVYKKLPSLFESIEKWPSQTNLLCWRCSLSFDTTPIFIPRVIEPVISKTKQNKFSIGVHGIFCSFSDAFAFIKDGNDSLIDKIESINKLKHLYKIFYNSKFKDIVAYPSVFDMIQYGGDMTTTQYKTLISKYTQNYES